jgi:parvulin-like peptidyl-prolyl isomerase
MKVINLFLLSFLCFITIHAQDTDDNAVLGTAGFKNITVLDFQERFEFTPQLGKMSDKTIKEYQLKFLYTLLSEKLWAIDATEKGYDTTSVMRRVTKAFEDMFIRDRLFMIEIRGKAKYSRQEYLQAVKRQATKLYVNYLFSEDSTEIFKLYSLIKARVPFDSILSVSPEKVEQKKPEEIVYGQMSEEMENELYKLKKDECSKPLESPEGWYIFKLVNKIESVVIGSENGESNIAQNAKKVLTARKEQMLQLEYYKNLLKNKRIDADAKLVKSLAFHISQILSAKKIANHIRDTVYIPLMTNDVADIQWKLGSDTLAKVLFTIGKQQYTVNDFLLALGFDIYKTNNPEINAVYRTVHVRLRKYIENELIAEQGRKVGLADDPEVKRELALWKDNYLYSMSRTKSLDSVVVSDTEALAYYNQIYKENFFPKQVNIIEILTDDVTTAMSVLEQAKAGNDFRELAKKYNRRKDTQKSGGEYGYFPVFLHGEIGEAAAKMVVNDIYGPIKLKEGYSVIKLIGKKDEYVEYPSRTFEQVKDEIKDRLTYERVKRVLDYKTVDLARKYGINISSKAIENLQTSTVTSFGVHYLGFGGQVMAAPLLAPDNDWVEIFFKQQNVTP